MAAGAAVQGWRVRVLHPADAMAAAALIRSAFARQDVVTDPPPSALGETEAGVLAMHGGAVAAIGPGALAGVVLWRKQDGALYVGRLAVAPAWRGRGIARALMAAAEQAATAAGLGRLLLSTRLVLVSNRRLFAACGFVETASHAHPGYRHPTFVEMEKRLVPGRQEVPRD
jgi:predicted N-acetyltransferase YhbS